VVERCSDDASLCPRCTQAAGSALSPSWTEKPLIAEKPFELRLKPLQNNEKSGFYSATKAKIKRKSFLSFFKCVRASAKCEILLRRKAKIIYLLSFFVVEDNEQ
jgi:hypothetical protein